MFEIFLAYVTPRPPRSVHKKFQPNRSSRLAGYREHINDCLVLLYRLRSVRYLSQVVFQGSFLISFGFLVKYYLGTYIWEASTFENLKICSRKVWEPNNWKIWKTMNWKFVKPLFGKVQLRKLILLEQFGKLQVAPL